MRKEGRLIVILFAFSLIFSSFAVADGCCLDKTKVGFCTNTTPAGCSPGNYLEGVSCENTGVCITGISSCCLGGTETEKCMPAERSIPGGITVNSPLVCADPSFFVKQACSDFSECQLGCSICGSGTDQSVRKLYNAISYCSIRDGLVYFNTSVAENTTCANTPIPSPAVSYSVSGFVKSASNMPLTNVAVTISGITQNTDSLGAYTISSVVPGTFTILAQNSDYFQNISTLVIDGNKTGINFTLSPIPKSTLIVTANYPSGAPAAGVNIVVGGASQITDASGMANMGALPRYTSSNVVRYYPITATLGTRTNSTITNLSSSATTTVTIIIPLGGNGSVNGTVYDSTGLTIAGVNISIAGRSLTTEPNGYYHFDNISVGTYNNMQISAPAPYLGATESVTIIENATITHDITLAKTIEQQIALLTINVKNSNTTAPIENADIKIGLQDDFSYQNFKTSVNGSFSLNILKNTNYVFTISKPGYDVATATVNIQTDSVFNYTLEPVEGLSIYGWVKDTAGNALQGVSVYISRFYEDYSAVTDSDGYYSISNVNYNALIPYTVNAENAGYKKSSEYVFLNTPTNKEQNFTLTPRACAWNDASSSPQISEINLQKNKSVLKIEMPCAVGGYFVYRCEGTGCSDTKPITNLISPTELEFSDETIKPGKCYTYELHSFFEKPFVTELVSNKTTICAGAKECFNIETDELCYANTRSKCDENNTIVAVQPSSAGVYCIQDGEKTKYLNRINCSLECNKPLGMFAVFGVFNLLIGGALSPANCSQPSVFSDLAYCYEDYAQTVVSRYYSCDNIKTCYDYQSQDACSANLCQIDPKQECAWRASANDLSLGVCMPKQEKYWNCSRCDVAGKFNDVFGVCNPELCDLYGGELNNDGSAKSHYCFFTGSPAKCSPNNILSCEDYRNNAEYCLGKNWGNVSVNITNTNSLIQESKDLLGFGLCRFGSSSESYLYSNLCFKDANNDYLHDPQATDMDVPFTSVIHPTAVNTINFPFIVYDDESSKNSTLLYGAQTYYSITAQNNFARPNVPAQNGMSFAGLNQSNVNYTVWFYSKDDADNLEIVKSFTVYVDLIPPEVNFTYNYAGGSLDAILQVVGSAEDIRCTSKLFDEDGVQIPGDDLSLNNSGKTLIASYEVTDGVYFFNYSCVDWVNNPILGNKVILVDSEGMIYDEYPFGITIKDSSVEISAKTMADAECRYIDASDGNGSFLFTDLSEAQTYYGYSSAEQLFSNMTKFDPTGLREHSSYVSVAEPSIAKLFLIRCRIGKTGNLTQSNIAQIKFTIDQLAPNTTFFEGAFSDLTSPIPFDTGIWRRSANILLECVDPQSPTVLPNNNPLYSPREFGCQVLNYCTALGISCTPKPLNISYTNASGSSGVANGTKTNVIFNETRTVCYYSVDNGGNQENTTCKLVPIDTVGPRVKIIDKSGLCRDYNGIAYCRTNMANISVNGTVDNAAYWSKKGGDLPYFKDFNFSAVVITSNVSEIIFDLKSNESYDFIQINFLTKNITYGQRGNAVTKMPLSVNLEKGVPVTVSITTQGENATIKLNGITQGTFGRTNTEGWIRASNQSVYDILVLDPLMSAPMANNVSVFINGNDTGHRIPIDINGFFSDTIYVGEIYLYGLVGKVEFRVSDEAGNVGNDSIWVEIDQIGPEEAPQFDPPIDSSRNQEGENYDILGYPFHYENGTYYLGGNSLYLTGITTESGERLELWNETSKLDEFTQVPNQTYTKIPDKLIVAQSVSKGNNSVLVIGDKTALISQVGTEAFAILESHRTEYGNYKDAYPVISAEIVSGLGTRLNLGVPLEYNVAKDEKITIVNKQTEAARFKLNSTMAAPGGYGTAFLHVRQFDDLNNFGSPSDVLPIVIDNLAPNITSFSPSVTSGILPSLSNISVEIYERGSGLRYDNINFTINGQNLRNGLVITKVPGFEGVIPTATYKIFYNYPKTNGTYLINLRVTDKANNPVNMSWNLTLDPALPRNPSFFVVNGVNISVDPDGWTFVNATPQVVADYSEEGKPFGIIEVFASWVKILTLNETVAFTEIPTTCVKLSATDKFNCTIDVGSLGLADLPGDGDYQLELRSFKNFSDETISSVKQDWFLFAKDSQAPIIENFTIMNEYMKSNAPIYFSLKVPNERHKVKASLVLVNNNTPYNIFTNLSLQLGESSVYQGYVSNSTMVNLPFVLHDNQEYTIRINVSDYAGNFNDSSIDTVIIDDTAPAIYSDNITINATPLYIYRYPATIAGENVIYMIRKDILEISGRVPTDVQNLSFYKGTSLIVRVTPCKTESDTYCINATSGYFRAVPTTQVVFGEEGKIVSTLVQAIAVDRAGNIGTTLKRLYSDLENLKVRICVNEDCTGTLTETTPPVTNVSQMINICQQVGKRYDMACYEPLITGACTENQNLNPVCFRDYISETKIADLWGLCNLIPLYRDDCLYKLAQSSSSTAVCNQVYTEAIRKACIEKLI